MNYNNLFPNIIKQLPNIPEKYFCYNYNRKINYNKNKSRLNAYIPYGKKMIIWFVKFESDNYSILLEMNNNNTVHKCHFKYISFDPILCLGCGSLFSCIQINNELCLNKIVYLKGEYYRESNIGKHIVELKYIISNYINNITHSSLLQIKIPVLSDESCIFNFVGNLGYNVNSIVSLNNNYTHNINNFIALFDIELVDIKKDIYNLYCNNNNNERIIYDKSIINNCNSSLFVKKMFNNNITYHNIEYSDNEDSELEHNNNQTKRVYCIYITTYNKWLPYRKCNNNQVISNINQIKQLERKYLQL